MGHLAVLIVACGGDSPVKGALRVSGSLRKAGAVDVAAPLASLEYLAALQRGAIGLSRRFINDAKAAGHIEVMLFSAVGRRRCARQRRRHAGVEHGEFLV